MRVKGALARQSSKQAVQRGAALLSRLLSPLPAAVAIRAFCAADDLARRLHEDNVRSEWIAAAGIDACGYIGAGLAHHLRIELVVTHVAAAFTVALLVAWRMAFCCAFAFTAALMLLLGLTRGFPPSFSFEPDSPQFPLALASAIAALVLFAWPSGSVAFWMRPLLNSGTLCGRRYGSDCDEKTGRVRLESPVLTRPSVDARR